MSDPETQPAQPQRRPLQFSLRTVFLVFFVVAVLLGFWTLWQRERSLEIESVRLADLPCAA